MYTTEQGESLSWPDDWYGPRTLQINDIIRRATAISWFHVPRPPDLLGKVRQASLAYLSSLRDVVENPAAVPLRPTLVLFEGPWKLLHRDQCIDDSDTPCGPRWNDSICVVGELSRLIGKQIQSDEHIREQRRPPLWPEVKFSNVVGEAIVAHWKRKHLIDRHCGCVSDRNVAWHLLCDAEDSLWNALEWEFARSYGLVDKPNPFLHLLELYELGVFPMGWVEDAFEVYVPKDVIRPS